jgi:hypothetical protein
LPRVARMLRQFRPVTVDHGKEPPPAVVAIGLD